MPRFRALAFGLTFAATLGAAGKNDRCTAASSASDVQFELAVKDHGAIFRTGEIVPLTLSFRSSTKDRYTAMMATSDRSGRVPEERYCVEPEAPDPLESYFNSRGVMGGGLRSIQQLSESPLTADVELNEWRTLKPGHYRVYAISSRVSRPRDPQEDTPSPSVGETLRSNTIDIEVTEADAAWQAEQLRTATLTLAGKPSPEEARYAARVLRFLSSEDAARAIAKLFWGLNPQQPIGWELMFGLYGSPSRQVAIDAMHAEIAVPDHAITSEFLDTLVNLQMIADPQWSHPPEGNPPNQEEMQSYYTRRRTREQALMKEEIATVVESLPRKVGSARALTLNGLLSVREANPALAQSARPALAAAWGDLPAETQEELIQYRWAMVAGSDMLPILRKIVAEPPPSLRTQAAMTRNAALKHLFELDPAGGREEILRDLQNPNADPGMDVVQLLSKEELAPVVRSATERIEKGGERQLDFEIVDRYAGDGAIPVVRAAFEKNLGQWACAPQSAMLRYFLRVSPEYGAQEVSASLAARKHTGCYRSLLEDLGALLPKAQQSATDALDDPDPEVVQNAVRALGRWGSKDAGQALWERLKRLHKEWEGREDELRPAADPKTAGWHGAALEAELVTAIGTGPGWVCPPNMLAQLSELVWTKVQKQEIEGWAKQWEPGSATIGPIWFPEDRPTFSLLQYNSLTEDQLAAKVSQLPQSMELQWQFWPAGTISPPVSMEKQEAAYERVRAAVAAHGIVIGKVKPLGASFAPGRAKALRRLKPSAA